MLAQSSRSQQLRLDTGSDLETRARSDLEPEYVTPVSGYAHAENLKALLKTLRPDRQAPTREHREFLVLPRTGGVRGGDCDSATK